MYHEKQKIYCFVFSLIMKIKKALSHITHQPPPPLISEKSKVNCEKFEVNQIVHTLRSLRKGYSIIPFSIKLQVNPIIDRSPMKCHKL